MDTGKQYYGYRKITGENTLLLAGTGGLHMKYTKEERLDIGRRIYDGEFTIYSASQQFEICTSYARDYMRSYRDIHQLPVKTAGRGLKKTTVPKSQDLHDMHDLEAMTREELTQEVVKSRIA